MRRILLAVLVTCACLPATPTGRMPRPTPITTPAPLASSATAWRSHRQEMPVPFHLETTAIVTISGDGPGRTDTLHAVLEARAAQLPGNTRRWDGDLTAYAVAANQAVLASLPGLITPMRFSAELGSVFRFPTPGTACTEPALSVMQGMYDAFIVLPDTLRVGREWRDSVVTATCRDRIPLTGAMARHFRITRVESRDGHPVLTIERLSSSTLHGTGDQFGERIELTGSGEGTLTYLLDAETSRWLSASGTSTLSLSFKSARRSQRVVQRSVLSMLWAR